MADLKIKTKPEETIKKKDRNIVGVQKIKDKLITTKEKINGSKNKEENKSDENYASNKVQDNINYISRKTLENSDKIGKKSINKTKKNIENIRKEIKSIKEKSKKETVQNKINEKTGGTLAKKEVKTTEHITGNAKKYSNESIKKSQQFAMNTKKKIQNTKENTRRIIKRTTEILKKVMSSAKAIIYLLLAGGWIFILIILIIAIIGSGVAFIFNSSGDKESGITNASTEIILVAKSQIGNEGGNKFWKWYGFNEHVEWCACFVSWCANECEYIDKGIIPKFSYCDDAIKWFEDKEEWHSRNDSYFPMSGDLIFFDWKDEKSNQDNISDHVGIVTKIDIDSKKVYTIEGNTSNQCAERTYSFHDMQIMGYASPKYE